MTIGAIDGSTGLGVAMQVHVTGAMRDQEGRSTQRDELYRKIVEHGALLNNAATEEGGGSPSRGAVPGTVAALDEKGTWRLTGEKTWTTWLPNLTHVFVTARFGIDDEIGRFIVRLDDPGVRRLPGFEALGMRGSASGRLVLERAAGEPFEPRRPPERARSVRVVRRRRPGSGSRSRRRTSGSAKGRERTSCAGPGTADPATARRPWRASRACSFGSVAWTPSSGPRGSWSWTWPVAGTRDAR